MWIALLLTFAMAAGNQVDSLADLQARIAAAKPGVTLTVKDGVYAAAGPITVKVQGAAGGGGGSPAASLAARANAGPRGARGMGRPAVKQQLAGGPAARTGRMPCHAAAAAARSQDYPSMGA